MAGLEEALGAIEAQIEAAQKSAEKLAKHLRKLGQAAQAGQIAEIEKGLAQAAELGGEAAAGAASLAGAWSFDARGWLGGGYLAELIGACRQAGLELTEKDGRIYAFPLVLRIAADQAAVRVGKKLERRIRPAALAKLLAAQQKRGQKLSEPRFLETLYRAYQMMAPDWRKAGAGDGPLIRLSDIHQLLTLGPGADYPIEEFGRDLLALDRKPDLRTRDGARFEFPGSALARERVTPIIIFDEAGRERSYLGLRFVREA